MQREAIFKKLGYCFHNLGLLERALRHRSMGKISNERLEFLGDAALNFTIAAELYHRYPDMKEGDLSRLRANLVNGEVLADLAGELQIGDYLQFGLGELKSGGARRKSILADAMEAIIGAMYLDGGFQVVQRCVVGWFATRLDAAAGVAQKDPKTLLQELLQMRKLPLPTYVVDSTIGVSHSQIFTIKCMVFGVDEATIGIGPNKRRAQRDAAEKMLAKIKRDKLI
ncbi:MAG: ribonuclease III [bacterium]